VFGTNEQKKEESCYLSERVKLKSVRSRRSVMRKFKEFIQDSQKSVSGQLQLNILEGETDDSEIADAATVIIGSELSTRERETLSESFVDGIRRMSERGGTIMAIAVALE
jgi:hypothetical protein